MKRLPADLDFCVRLQTEPLGDGPKQNVHLSQLHNKLDSQVYAPILSPCLRQNSFCAESLLRRLHIRQHRISDPSSIKQARISLPSSGVRYVDVVGKDEK